MGKCLRSIILILLTTMTITAAGCANMRGFGTFVPDNEVKTAFETFQINQDYRYYITGSDTYPIAIFALHKSYTINNDSWKELQLTPSGLQELVTFMQLRLFSCCMQTQRGFWVYDQQGRQIGMLYSYLGVVLSFKLEDNGVLKIYGPQDSDELKRYQERGNGDS